MIVLLWIALLLLIISVLGVKFAFAGLLVPVALILVIVYLLQGKKPPGQ